MNTNTFLKKYLHPAAIILIFAVHAYFRLYNLEKWMPFGWDQVDNAWAAAKILVAHKYPLVGMVAKQNSGFYIGPLYYYFVSIFYAVTKLHPIASGVIAALTGFFSFAVIYSVSKKLFNPAVALISVLVYTFSMNIIVSERVQWPVNFIAPLSLIIFYFLFKMISGNPKYIIPASIFIGLMFHIHATALFFPVILLLLLPILKWDRKTLPYLLISVFIVSVFLSPISAYYMQTGKQHRTNQYSGYIQSSYHGFHLRRMIQISRDAFIKFQTIWEQSLPVVKKLIFFFIPAFFITVLLSREQKYKMHLLYLTGLWFFVPWIAFTTYSGEISDYYFNLELYVAVIILSYLLWFIWNSKIYILRGAVILLLGYIMYSTVIEYPKAFDVRFDKNDQIAKTAAETGAYINFADGDPKSYLYYYYMYTLHKPLPYKL